MYGRVLLIGAGNEGMDIISKAKEYGLKVSNINQPGSFRQCFLEHLEDVVIIDYQNIEKTIGYARQMYHQTPFDGVVSLSENALVTTVHVARSLGVQGNSVESVESLKNKSLMREKLNSAGVSCVPYEEITNELALKAFAQRTGFPLIIKPIAGTRSEQVYKVNNRAELSSTFLTIQPLLEKCGFICEQYLDGPELSVEAFTCHGEHTIIAVTDKLTNENHIELGHSIPSIYASGSDSMDAITQTVSHFLDTIGITTGPTHTEMRLTSDGWKVIESHNRVGGDRINELVALAYGIDLRAYTIGWLTGLEPPLTQRPELQAVSAIRFITASPGIVEHIHIDQAIYNSPHIREFKISIKPGDKVNPLRSSSDRVGHIIVTADSRDQADTLLEQYLSMISIHTL